MIMQKTSISNDILNGDKFTIFPEKLAEGMHFSSFRIIKKTNSGQIRQLLGKTDL
jgi:hypothetical protein